MTCEKPERANFVIIHDYQETPGVCMPGEEIAAIILVYRGKRYRVPLASTHLILMDFLARCRFPEDAWRISARIQSDPFTADHGLNAPGQQVRPSRSSRVAVRQQVKRIRAVLAELIAEEGLNLHAEDIIRSEETSTRVVRYLLHAGVTWEHLHLRNFDESTTDTPATGAHSSAIRAENSYIAGSDVGSVWDGNRRRLRGGKHKVN